MQKGDSQGPHIQKTNYPPPATIADEMLSEAYLCTQEQDMRAAMERIVEVCLDTQDRHFARVACLVKGHREGIVVHACRHISSDRIEGTNQMIKTLRRAG